MIDVMIDVENLGVQPDCAVLTIGAVQFDIHTGEIGATFYERIDRNKALKYGRMDLSTMRWWEDQDPAIRAEAFDGQSHPVTVAVAFRDWFARTFPSSPFVWGNGSCMDIVQLEWWLRNCDPKKDKRGSFAYPWAYYNIMDMRTIMRVAKLRMPRTRPEWVRHHHALDDAKYQVDWVCQAMKKCRGIITEMRPLAPAPPPPPMQSVSMPPVQDIIQQWEDGNHQIICD